MDFDFSDEQYKFQETTRGLLDKNYDLDRLRKLLVGDGLDRELWDRLAENGTFSLLVPEEHGGMGLGFVDLSLVLEEYGRALVPAPVGETLTATDAIVRFGTDEQKQRLLPLIAEGKLKIVPAIAEAEAGYDPTDIAVTAVPSGNGWSISGRKVLVPHAATADFIMLAARFSEDGPLGLALIEPDRAGVSLREHSTLDPSSRFHELDLDSVAVVRDDIVGGEPTDASVTRLLDAGGVIAATMMTGISGKVLDTSVEYAKQRTQFGKQIGSFQAIKHRCADMAVAIDASRSAAYYAAWALAEEAPDRARAVSMAKSYCGDTSRFVCNEGVQIHGGMGFTWELGLHFYLRRAKVLEYSYGDAAYHRERVLAETIDELGIGMN
ncbi:MAG: acyl-CoA/acyl-ACP dehydrogenase [Mesorhizobium sp.]|nr:acyl-CoA dehydrogenase family protein [Mesorhizobium sp.]MCO5164136.1 acyl-CoA/acyl-ACP dehydrogenase [Mesorhizobium sp.]